MATLEPFVRHGAKDPEVQALQDRVERFVRQLEGLEILRGRLLEDVTLVNSASNKATHRLGRTPIGCIQVSGSAGYVATMSAADDKELTLSCGTSQTASFWVF